MKQIFHDSSSCLLLQSTSVVLVHFGSLLIISLPLPSIRHSFIQFYPRTAACSPQPFTFTLTLSCACHSFDRRKIIADKFVIIHLLSDPDDGRLGQVIWAVSCVSQTVLSVNETNHLSYARANQSGGHEWMYRQHTPRSTTARVRNGGGSKLTVCNKQQIHLSASNK